MKPNEKIDVSTLLTMMVVQLTAAQLCEVIRFALGELEAPHNPSVRRLVKGVQALADALACSPSKIYALMRTPRVGENSVSDGGVLKDAIVSRIGRCIVFDADLARELADAHCKKQ